MKQRINDFHQDEEGFWVAKLSCGHGLHMRHRPPWQVREWVLNPEGRATRIGTLVECKKCDNAPAEK